MRKKVIAGNWKMNMLPNDTIDFINALEPNVKESDSEIIICVPFTDLFYAISFCQGTNIHVGAQNVFYEDSGAYTGEVSAQMLKCINTEYVIIGHSERRKYFAETDEIVNKKVHKAIENGLKPIICVGETLEEREQGKAIEKITSQISEDLKGLTKENLENIIIAYEPIWAIGTGKTATKEDANEAIKAIRSKINEQFGTDDITILYGGSVKPENANELFQMSDIDGALVGGASLKVSSFKAIIDEN